jgi:arylsulfatase B
MPRFTSLLITTSLWVACQRPSVDPAKDPSPSTDDTDVAPSPGPPAVRITPHLAVAGSPVRCVVTPPGPEVTWWRGDLPVTSGVVGDTIADAGPAGSTLSCEAGGVRDTVAVSNGQFGTNILLVILDDTGVDKISDWRIGAFPPPTPRISRLADEGVRFARAWANAVCSPTRAGILTGLHPMNNGIGHALTSNGLGLQEDFTTLPELLRSSSPHRYATAAFGKWHITGRGAGLDSPRAHGFDHFAGSIANLGEEGDYWNWLRIEDGVEAPSTVYATEDIVRSASTWIQAAPEPWFAWVGLHVAHTPFHAPPSGWTVRPVDENSPVANRIDGMIESADVAIGEILSAMSPEAAARTHVIVIADNGTAWPGVRPPLDPERAKASPYEGGIHVPLVMRGPLISRGDHLVPQPVNHVDLFPTIAEIAGVELTPEQLGRLDGRSLLPYLISADAPTHRRTVYSETFQGRAVDARTNWRRAVRWNDWKLIRWPSGKEELFDLAPTGLDERDLLLAQPLTAEAQAAYDELRQALDVEYVPRWDIGASPGEDTGLDSSAALP